VKRAIKLCIYNFNLEKMYKKSEQLLDRALKSIPLASQTFSKSLTQYPRGVSPFFIEKGKGARVWDVDGNEYIDFVNSLAAVTLGYCDENIDNAVQQQMKNGVIFSLPHTLEMEVAEKLIEIIPCAEKVRFAKNGTDATSASIRIARAYTGKEHIAVCGYHGWQDWYIGSTTRDLGVPKSVKELTHKFEYNDIESLEKIFQEQKLSCVIMEPMNVEYPKDNFLEKVKELVHKNNALLIFDETITGFRYSLGGAQELFGVVPDLATFGKGMANGYPLSAVVGSNKVMQKVEDIFFSGTFGGETLSLAAVNAVIKKYESQNVPKYLEEIGTYLLKQLNQLINSENLDDIFWTSGHPAWTFLHIKEQEKYLSFEIKTFFLQEMFKRGILTLGSHNLSFSHTKEDIDRLLKVYAEVLPMIRHHINNEDLLENIQGEILKPLFKVR
jgi:glutamate-1-semialdehyde 2,1-aminomutase